LPADDALPCTDDRVPLAKRKIAGVSTRFLTAIDWAFAVRPHDRLHSVAACASASNGRQSVRVAPLASWRDMDVAPRALGPSPPAPNATQGRGTAFGFAHRCGNAVGSRRGQPSDARGSPPKRRSCRPASVVALAPQASAGSQPRSLLRRPRTDIRSCCRQAPEIEEFIESEPRSVARNRAFLQRARQHAERRTRRRLAKPEIESLQGPARMCSGRNSSCGRTACLRLVQRGALQGAR